MVGIIIVAIISYLIGSVSFSVIFSKKLAGFDLRERGSGNAGSTNALRTAGKKVAILTLICDILKGVVAILLAIAIGTVIKAENSMMATFVQVAGIMVILGHTFPIFFGFKGGKGVATALGVLLITNWQMGLICLTFALVLMAISKMVSFGSVGAAILFPILCVFIKDNFIVSGSYFGYILFGIIVAGIVIFNHRSNVKRIFDGKENKISFK